MQTDWWQTPNTSMLAADTGGADSSYNMITCNGKKKDHYTEKHGTAAMAGAQKQH